MKIFVRKLSSHITADSIAATAMAVIKGDRLAIAKSITLLESTLSEDRELTCKLMKELHVRKAKEFKFAMRIGFTGSPGVGKSTLIEKFGLYLTQEQSKKLAVITVDPSSVKSGGSILGDKTRMLHLSQDQNAFIRSSPNRGDLGGVIVSTFDTIRLLEYAGFDVVIVETVGVGQSELAVADLVDLFVLLVAPGVGDELQGLKKGITEVADMILVNKADSPLDQAANQTIFEYKSAANFSLTREARKPVLPVSGKNGRGIPEVWETINNLFSQNSKKFDEKRVQQARRWTISVAQQELLDRFRQYLQLYKQKDSIYADESKSLHASASDLVNLYITTIGRK